MDFSAIVSDALRSGIGPIAAVYALAAMGLNLLVVGEGGSGVRPRALHDARSGHPVDERQRHAGSRGADDRVHACREDPVRRLCGNGLLARLVTGDHSRHGLAQDPAGVVDLLYRELQRLDLGRAEVGKLSRFRQDVAELELTIARLRAGSARRTADGNIRGAALAKIADRRIDAFISASARYRRRRVDWPALRPPSVHERRTHSESRKV
jgi:hypothetical protein